MVRSSLPPADTIAPAAAPLPLIEFPEALPVSARRDDIAAAIGSHQAVIVCGETGSGKTTQLPKILLAMGRGRANGGGTAFSLKTVSGDIFVRKNK